MKYYLLLVVEILVLVGCVLKEKSNSVKYSIDGEWYDASEAERAIEFRIDTTPIDFGITSVEWVNKGWVFTIADSLGVAATKKDGKWEIEDCERALNVSERTFDQSAKYTRQLQNTIDSLEKELRILKRNGFSLYSKN